MSRDNVLFIVIGILIGFIAGYLLQEVMAERQPPRLVHGQDGAEGQGGGAPAPGGASGQQQQAMEARLEEIRSLESYLASNPEDADAILRLANLSFDVESWSRCVESFEKYLELQPATPDILSDMGVCYRAGLRRGRGRPGRAPLPPAGQPGGGATGGGGRPAAKRRMTRLLLLILLAIALWLLLDWAFRKLLDVPRGARSTGRRPAGPGGMVTPLVRCDACGAYVPEPRCLRAAGGRRACSEACRTALRGGGGERRE